MGPQAAFVYESAIALLTLYNRLAVENREPTQEELVAAGLANRNLIDQTQAGIDARPD